MAISDTHPEAASHQLELVREASVGKRLAAVRSLTGTVARLSRRALRRRRPEATDSEIDRAFVEIHYGVDIARRLLGDR